MSSSTTDNNFGPLALRTAWLFQALAAAPTLLFLGAFAYFCVFGYGDEYWLYDFIASFLNTFFSAGIVFVVLIQRKIHNPSNELTLYFEATKSVLATVMWVWLVLDRAFGPWARYGYGGEPDRMPSVVRSAICSVILLVLFYPPLVYAALVYRKERKVDVVEEEDGERGERGEADERTALLGRQ
ncbi:hypothetical protein EJ08DRAFT_254222 [Tothia fuscella]|uniref:Uncharacterized protein n=1 Tax=Tothia fuscella TaxID=1048955 RepID=A0A9P4NR36_9PEZI|nr:hypothetical protein EJ08DRAFT_254222 [Tothia fuscella]